MQSGSLTKEESLQLKLAFVIYLNRSGILGPVFYQQNPPPIINGRSSETWNNYVRE